MKNDKYAPKRRSRPWFANLPVRCGALTLGSTFLLLVAALLLPRQEQDESLLSSFQKKNNKDPFAVPFCNPSTGVCHEDPNVASPRTVYSAKSKEQYDLWWRAHAALNVTASAFAAKQSNRPVILLGDSITESWMGTNMGEAIERAAGIPQVLQETLLQPRYGLHDVLVAAIGGDQTQHLLYRMQHGQVVPQSYAADEKAIFVVLIGTNNLGAGELPGPTVQGIVAVTNYLLQHTAGKILLLQLLPRGDVFRLKAICPPSCASSTTPSLSGKQQQQQPYRSFMPAIQKVNHALDEWYRTQDQDRLYLIDCGKDFLPISSSTSSGGDEVNKDLMPDLLHPNAAGHRLLGNCILRGLEDGFDLFA